jgi:serine/threonine protein kinase
MLIGKSAFDAEDMEELVSKVEDGTYSVATNLSREVISFLNGMLQYDSHSRLSSEDLYRHVFLTREVKDFHPIDMKKVSKKVDNKGLNINVKKNKTIWAIFNDEDEDKLNKIKGNQLDPMKPIDEKEELEHEKHQRNLSQEKKKANNDYQSGEGEIRQVSSFPLPNTSFPYTNSAYLGPTLPNPFQGIPGNPINQNIQGMSSSNQSQTSAFSADYVCRGGIFD